MMRMSASIVVCWIDVLPNIWLFRTFGAMSEIRSLS